MKTTKTYNRGTKMFFQFIILELWSTFYSKMQTANSLVSYKETEDDTRKNIEDKQNGSIVQHN